MMQINSQSRQFLMSKVNQKYDFSHVLVFF